MKLKLPKQLFLALLSAFTVVPHLASGATTELGQSDISADTVLTPTDKHVYQLTESLSFDGTTRTQTTRPFVEVTNNHLTFQGTAQGGYNFSMKNVTATGTQAHTSPLEVRAGLTFSNMGDITFESLKSDIRNMVSAICIGGGTLRFENTGNILFQHNTAGKSGYGAIAGWSQNAVQFSNTGSISFINNISESNMGAEGAAISARGGLSFSNIKGKITLKGNQADANSKTSCGGACYVFQGVFLMENVEDVLFFKNTSVGRGGALFVSEATFTLKDAGNVDFLGDLSPNDPLTRESI